MPEGFEKLIDAGGTTVIALLLVKIIWNDLRHLGTKLEKLTDIAIKSEKHLAKIAKKK